jgi:Flp pilus assembly protein TadG
MLRIRRVRLVGPYKLLRDISGSALVEATLVIPVMLVLALGTVDAAYMFHEWGLANKAAYRGARIAVVSNPVTSSVTGISFTAPVGQLCFVPTTGGAATDSNGNNLCPSINVLCVSGSCDSGTYNSVAFTGILTAMQRIFPRIAAGNVQILYQTNGLGFVGQPYSNPNVTQFALPMDVTVSITGMTHQLFFVPSILKFFGGGIQAAPSIPRFSTTLQSESMFTL